MLFGARLWRDGFKPGDTVVGQRDHRAVDTRLWRCGSLPGDLIVGYMEHASVWSPARHQSVQPCGES